MQIAYRVGSPLTHRQKAKCLLRLNHDRHAIIDRVTLGDQLVDAIDLLATLVYFSVQATFLLVRIFNILSQVLCSQPLLKDSLIL